VQLTVTDAAGEGAVKVVGPIVPERPDDDKMAGGLRSKTKRRERKIVLNAAKANETSTRQFRHLDGISL
jgi:hypothetical protein